MPSIPAWAAHSSRALRRSSEVTLNTQVSLLAAFAGLALTIACGSEWAGPGPLPSCGAHGTQLSLAVAQYTSINPASDSGCVTFAANASPDTAEYLVLPWSTGGTPATSTTAAPDIQPCLV